MQFEWDEGEVLKWVVSWGGSGGGGWRGRGKENGWWKRLNGGREVGIRSGAGRRGAKRGEPCRVCELWRSSFMSQLGATVVENGVGFELR